MHRRAICIRGLRALAACLWLAALGTGAVACGASLSAVPELEIRADRDSNRVTAAVEAGVLVFDVYSETGIGSARIELRDGVFRGPLVLRLHLRGLEQLRFAYGEVRLVASIASGAAKPVLETRQEPGDGRPLSPASPYFMKLRRVAEIGTARIPLERGIIEITAPRDLGSSGQRSFSIEWIDFFR